MQIPVSNGTIEVYLSSMGITSIAYMNAFSFYQRTNSYAITKEDALAAVKSILLENTATTVLITDINNQGMHKILSDNLPKQFNAISCKGQKVTVTVTKGKPYHNYNSGNNVKEVRLTLTKGWAAE